MDNCYLYERRYDLIIKNKMGDLGVKIIVQSLGLVNLN